MRTAFFCRCPDARSGRRAGRCSARARRRHRRLAGRAAAGSSAARARPGESAESTAPATDPQQPIFRTGINFVRVDVIVTDKSGKPVSDLKQTTSRSPKPARPQKIETFKLIELDGGLMPGPDGPARQIRTEFDEESEAARDDVRLFGLFLDDYHTREGPSLSARNEIARFVETQLGPSDMIGMMYPLSRSTPSASRAITTPSGAASSSSGAASSTTRRRTRSKSATCAVSRPSRRSRFATTCRCRRSSR